MSILSCAFLIIVFLAGLKSKVTDAQMLILSVVGIAGLSMSQLFIGILDRHGIGSIGHHSLTEASSLEVVVVVAIGSLGMVIATVAYIYQKYKFL